MSVASSTVRNELITAHYPMVRSIAQRVHRRLPRSVDIDDLISAGTAGLMEAVDRYDERQAVPFATFARYRIRGAVVDALRAQDWVPRSVRRKADVIDDARRTLRNALGRAPTPDEVARALELPRAQFEQMERDAEVRPLLSLDAPVGDEGSSALVEHVPGDRDDFEACEQDELAALVVDAVQGLPDRERSAVALYYFHELTLKEVGEILGVTESRACQLCGQGIKRLRKRLASAVD